MEKANTRPPQKAHNILIGNIISPVFDYFYELKKLTNSQTI